MKVLVIDDSAFMRKIISQMIDATPGFEVVGQARNGKEGVEFAVKLRPDLITMDIEMPELDGLGAIRQIRLRCRDFSPAVLMCSSLTVEGSYEALKAMRLGAADVIAKDPAVVGRQDAGFRDELIGKLKTIGAERRRLADHHEQAKAHTTAGRPVPHPGAHPDTHKLESVGADALRLGEVDAVVIGSSTGGPPALEDVLSPLPAGLRVPIIICQHMPAVFTKSLTARLAQMCRCGATLVSEGTLIDRPTIYMAEGGRHLHLSGSRGRVRAEMRDEPTNATYRPSVDVLFETASRVFGPRVLAIQLTGMGEDGAKGAARLKAAGGRIIAQHHATCVVYGMPKAVVEAGLADAIMTPPEIARALSGLCAASPESEGGILTRKSA